MERQSEGEAASYQWHSGLAPGLMRHPYRQDRKPGTMGQERPVGQKWESLVDVGGHQAQNEGKDDKRYGQ